MTSQTLTSMYENEREQLSQIQTKLLTVKTTKNHVESIEEHLVFLHFISNLDATRKLDDRNL